MPRLVVADFIFALENFPLRVQFAVIRQDDVGGLAHDEIVADLDAELASPLISVSTQSTGSMTTPLPMTHAFFCAGCGRHEVRTYLCLPMKNGVAGVVARLAGVADDDVRVLVSTSMICLCLRSPHWASDQKLCLPIFFFKVDRLPACLWSVDRQDACRHCNKNPRTGIRGKARVFAQRG